MKVKIKMKAIFLTYIFFLLSIALVAQSTYQEAIAMGDQAFKKEKYRNALNYYFAAEAFDPTKKVIVKKKISAVFDKIEQLKNDAQQAEKIAKIAVLKQQEAIRNRQIAEKEREKALYYLDSINKRNQKLIDAFYFYDNKFALSIKTVAGRRRYGFINRDAETVIPYLYQECSLFDPETGFAKAKKRGASILLDTMGREYDVAYKVEDLQDYTLALDLRDEPLDSFPIEVLNYPQLEVIILNRRINGEKRIIIPKEIGQLKKLTQLYLDRCLITSFPKEIGELKKLEILKANACELFDLPEEIGNLENLKILDAMYNRLVDLPENIGNLTKLEILNVSYSKISQIPQSINQLQGLKELDLSSTRISEISETLLELKHLEVLDIGNCRVKSIPTEISKLTNLIRLDLNYNDIEVLPREIGTLKHLRALGLRGNQIQVLPTEIGGLQSLVYLQLAKNQLEILPESIGDLRNIKVLTLEENALTTIPEAFSRLSQLTNLSIRYNRFSESEKERIKRLLPPDCQLSL